MPSRHSKRLLSGSLLATAVLLAVTGCQKDTWMARTHPVEGKITINGEAPKDAFIKLIKLGEPIDKRESDSWAIVQADGSYSFTTYEPGDGCPTGEYAWIIRWPANLMTMMPDKLGEKYWDQEDPYMTVTIEPGHNELPLVELEGVKVKSS